MILLRYCNENLIIGCVEMLEEAIARINSEGKTQLLYDHAKNVASISVSISRYPNTSKLIAYLHDFGKSSAAFQNYLLNGGERGSVIHAWQGAFLANELFIDESACGMLMKEIIGFCVTAHHNHFDDGVAPDGETNYFDKFSNSSDTKYSFSEIKEKVTKREKVELQALFEKSKQEISDLLTKINSVYKNRSSANFALGLFIKYLYSCLVDADRLDAYLFDANEPYCYQSPNWDSLISIFEDNICKFTHDTKMNIIRKSISDKCKSAADSETGIYQLSVQTGGGKTLSSLRFALHHCKKYEKKRIIYVIPYLSIIEQTAKSLNKIFNLPEYNEVIFEHHSNIIEPEDEKTSELRKLAAARWDNPIILTTMVQFMETVMSAKSGKLRKFASMADTVIIIDEIQSMPVKAVHCINEVVTFLSKILNATIILCSATQPTLETTQRENLLLHDDAKLIDCLDDFKDVKRVTVSVESEKDCETATDFILDKADENGNCLAIVNTKKSALEIYNRLNSKKADFEILHLSTSMCSIHRIQIINKIKDCLENHKKVICVSTQLIEAGVDLSFSCVVRTMSGLDSIAQAAGRCNRNWESAAPKTVYTFQLKDENLDKLNDIKSGKEITAQIVQNKTVDYDFLDEKVMAEYYQRFFAPKDSQMDYPVKDGGTIYSMLSGNNSGKKNYTNRTGKQFTHLISHAFLSADTNFNMIENNTKSVVVTYGESEKLLDEYRTLPAEILTKEKIRILKKLQKYSVSLYEWQLKKLAEQNAIYVLDAETGIIILGSNYYSQATGVVLEAIQDNLII
ncbi:MAG: CRISPR-associated helicase Cas3' [Eubacteriales bacterium]|nr:CRISPR-associated helicase Cas3' [Eubacteriales bacterium]